MRKSTWRGSECPKEYEIKSNGGMKQLVLYVDIKQSSDEAEGYTATKIEMPIGEFNYGHIVSALINAQYSSDQMQAIVNNHLLGDSDHEEEYKAMQAWRREAKERAKRVIGEIGGGGKTV